MSRSFNSCRAVHGGSDGSPQCRFSRAWSGRRTDVVDGSGCGRSVHNDGRVPALEKRLEVTYSTLLTNDLRYSSLSRVLLAVCRGRHLRRICGALLLRLEGGEFYSGTLRLILEQDYGVKVGAYSYGPCMTPGVFPSGVVVGRYVSVGPGVRVFLRNHPLDRFSLHPFFYNQKLGWVVEDTIQQGQLEIGHDSWIGANAIITKGCRRIGIGSVVGAGAVVTRDVPDFAIVGGNPARVLRMRFPETVCQALKASQWWLSSPAECMRYVSDSKPLTEPGFIVCR